MNPETYDLPTAAAAYAASGWAVFPCRGKLPWTPNGFHDATTDLERVGSWWKARPQANIGAPVPPTLAVIDFDAKNGGLETLRLFEETQGVPETLTTLTGGGGLHLWFEHPGFELRQGAGILGPGVDTRMPGRGYVLLPPSIHPDTGTFYEWYQPAHKAVTMPPWMVGRLRKPKPPPSKPTPQVTAGDRYVEAAINGELAKVAAATEGTRNGALYLAALNIGTLLGDSAHSYTETLITAGRNIGLGESETAKTVASGLAWGIDHPREVRAS